MDLIKDCSQTGFHTHAPTANGQKIYELCGHVRQLLLPHLLSAPKPPWLAASALFGDTWVLQCCLHSMFMLLQVYVNPRVAHKVVDLR